MKKEFIKKYIYGIGNDALTDNQEAIDMARDLDEYTRNHDLKQRLTNQLFIGKVTEEIGFEKTMKLLKETKQAIDKL